MRTITASKARQGFAELLESVDQGPVVIERQRRGVAVVMSVAEYWRLRQLDSAAQAWALAQPDAQGTSPAGRQEEEGSGVGLATGCRKGPLPVCPCNGKAEGGRWEP